MHNSLNPMNFLFLAQTLKSMRYKQYELDWIFFQLIVSGNTGYYRDFAQRVAEGELRFPQGSGSKKP